LADDPGVAAEALLPEAVAEEDDRMGADRDVFLRQEVAAYGRPGFVQPEEVAGDLLAEQELGPPAVVPGGDREVDRGELRKDVVPLPDVREVGVGPGGILDVPFLAGIDLDELLRPHGRELAEEDGVDEAEDRAVGADAQSQGQNGENGHAGLAGHLADGVAQVLDEIAHGDMPSCGTRRASPGECSIPPPKKGHKGPKGLKGRERLDFLTPVAPAGPPQPWRAGAARCARSRSADGR